MRQSPPVRARRFAARVALTVVALLATVGLGTPAHAAGAVYFVAPTGDAMIRQVLGVCGYTLGVVPPVPAKPTAEPAE